MSRTILITALLVALGASAGLTTCGCRISSTGAFILDPDAKYGTQFDAWGKFANTLNDTGVSTLHVYTNYASTASDEDVLFCAGMVEGYLTHAHIATHYKLYRDSTLEDMGAEDEWPSGLVDFVTKNIKYTRANAALKKDEWWAQVAYVLAHTDGVREGYLSARAGFEPVVDEVDWWILQSAGDMDDIQGFVHADGTWGSHRAMTNAWHDTHHHCTGSVFLAPGYQDLWFAQDAWQSYTVMNRIQKEYNFALKDQGASRVWAFPSHPGLSFSMDDFWVLDSGLLVLETTLHTWNTTLYDLYCKPETVFCFIRVQVANRLATDGQSWVKNFVRENSGTYNNQYFVVDLNKFTPGVKPQKDLLWAVEQLPGDYEAGDRTAELAQNMYVPSINTPFFDRIYAKANYPQKVEETKSQYWTYWNCSRMRIFQRDAPKVETYEQYKSFMRSNRYQTDPLCHNDPAQAILSRYDLRPDECLKDGTLVMCPNSFGGTDAKTTRYTLAKKMQFDMVNSPNYEDQDPWQFGTERYKDVPYDGMPAVWKFPWTSFAPEMP